MERSEIRGQPHRLHPDFASLNPGYTRWLNQNLRLQPRATGFARRASPLFLDREGQCGCPGLSRRIRAKPKFSVNNA